MILSDRDIKKAIKSGHLVVDPYREESVQPVSGKHQQRVIKTSPALIALQYMGVVASKSMWITSVAVLNLMNDVFIGFVEVIFVGCDHIAC